MPKVKSPLEAAEMRALKQWADLHPICKDYLFHIPNGGTRNPREAKNLKLQGVRPGVSDLFLAFPSNGFHGLFIEMKRADGRSATEEQLKWIERVESVGYRAVVCYGWENAVMHIGAYLFRYTKFKKDNFING